MSNRLEGKVVLITGGGSGMGRAGAEACAAAGATVVGAAPNYDTDRAARVMEARERAILATLGVPDPYALAAGP